MATPVLGQKISEQAILQSITGNEELVVAYQGRNYKVTIADVLATANGQGANAPTLIMSLVSLSNSSVGRDTEMTTFDNTTILASTDAQWDAYSNTIKFLTTGIYRVVFTCRVNCVDSYGSPSTWPANIPLALGSSIIQEGSVLPADKFHSRHTRPANGTYETGTYEQWTDEYLFNCRDLVTDSLSPTINAGSSILSYGGLDKYVAYSLVLTVTRIAAAIANT